MERVCDGSVLLFKCFTVCSKGHREWKLESAEEFHEKEVSDGHKNQINLPTSGFNEMPLSCPAAFRLQGSSECLHSRRYGYATFASVFLLM